METVYETLSERVDELIEAHKGELLSTTGDRAAIRELTRRTKGLEWALREIAHEVESSRPGQPIAGE